MEHSTPLLVLAGMSIVYTLAFIGTTLFVISTLDTIINELRERNTLLHIQSEQLSERFEQITGLVKTMVQTYFPATGIHTYDCPLCELKFCELNDYREHLVVGHKAILGTMEKVEKTSELDLADVDRPWKCKDCLARFQQREALVEHWRIRAHGRDIPAKE